MEDGTCAGRSRVDCSNFDVSPADASRGCSDFERGASSSLTDMMESVAELAPSKDASWLVCHWYRVVLGEEEERSLASDVEAIACWGNTPERSLEMLTGSE